MSEKQLKILLSELTLVRLRCQNEKCGIVTETTIDRLDRVIGGSDPCCPVCHERFRVSKSEPVNHLANLQAALQGVANMRSVVEVEFVLPDQE